MIAYIILFNVICILAHKLLAPYGVQKAVMSEESLKERELTVKGDRGKSDEVAITVLPQVVLWAVMQGAAPCVQMCANSSVCYVLCALCSVCYISNDHSGHPSVFIAPGCHCLHAEAPVMIAHRRSLFSSFLLWVACMHCTVRSYALHAVCCVLYAVCCMLRAFMVMPALCADAVVIHTGCTVGFNSADCASKGDQCAHILMAQLKKHVETVMIYKDAELAAPGFV